MLAHQRAEGIYVQDLGLLSLFHRHVEPALGVHLVWVDPARDRLRVLGLTRPCVGGEPLGDVVWGSVVRLTCPLKNGLIFHQIPQLDILLPEVLKLPGLRDLHVAVALAPVVEGLLGGPE